MFRPVFVLMILACFLLPAFLPAEDAAQVKGPIALVQVKAGSFKMGSEDGYREKPIHLVTLSHAFFIGAKEVTQAQYKAVMGENPSEFKGDDLPVDSVSWYDAMKFCSKLTESERKNGHLPKEMEYRLPTEAEWEYCCRAGSTSKFCVGDDDALLGDYAWSKENSEEKTHPVGGKKPNDWGIYDMHGNVYEYCLDWFEEVYRAEDQTDPIAAAKMENRVFRGGSWNNEAQYCRSSIRRSCDPVSKSEYTGFRVVVAVGNLGVDALKVEETWRNEALRTPLVAISPGTFSMGSEKGDDDEKPIRQVTIEKAFSMGAKEISQAQYRVVMESNPSEWVGSDLPVHSVSWDDAMEYCRKRTETERKAGRLPKGMEYRLPTEAEWEYCCRAGTTTEFCGGDGAKGLDDYGWYGSNSDSKLHPVGTKKPNAWGLYDMHGNISEWCYDLVPHVRTAEEGWGGPPEGNYREVRGGFFGQKPRYCRSAQRDEQPQVLRSPIIGFRVVLAEVGSAK